MIITHLMGRSGSPDRRGAQRDAGASGKCRPRMSYLGPPAGRPAPPKAAVSSPLTAPFGYMGADALWCTTPRRTRS